MKYLKILAVLLIVSSCGLKEENEQLKSRLASMEAKMETNEQLNNEMADQLNDVGAILDSIQVTEVQITSDLEKGTSYENYTEQIRTLNDYLENSKQQLAQMEEAMANSTVKNRALSATIAKLRTSVTEKENKIRAMEEQVERYRSENANLIRKVDLQRREIRERDQEIVEKRMAVQELEEKIETMLAEAKAAEASAYFAQAKGMEEAANRTKLAPRKKRRTYKKAYDLYKKAFEAGKTDAYAKMEELEDKI
jgi:chromosome segregation ATPase